MIDWLRDIGVSLAAAEIWGSLPLISRAVIWLQTLCLPGERRETRRKEWNAELHEEYKDRRIAGLIWTLSLIRICAWEGATTPIGLRFARAKVIVRGTLQSSDAFDELTWQQLVVAALVGFGVVNIENFMPRLALIGDNLVTLYAGASCLALSSVVEARRRRPRWSFLTLVGATLSWCGAGSIVISLGLLGVTSGIQVVDVVKLLFLPVLGTGLIAAFTTPNRFRNWLGSTPRTLARYLARGVQAFALFCVGVWFCALLSTSGFHLG